MDDLALQGVLRGCRCALATNGPIGVRLMYCQRNSAGAPRLNVTVGWVGSLVVSVSVALRMPGAVGMQPIWILAGGAPLARLRLTAPTSKSSLLAPPRTALLTVSVAVPSSLTLRLTVLSWPTSTSPKSIGPGASGVEPKPGTGTAVALQIRS